MNRMIITVMAIGLFSLTVSVAAFADFNVAQFIGIDRDADNKVSVTEARDYRIRYFTTLDLDASGVVSFEEYIKANQIRRRMTNSNLAVPVPPEYEEADANKDTNLTLEELLAVGVKRFAILDKDKDGYVSREEFVSPGL